MNKTKVYALKRRNEIWSIHKDKTEAHLRGLEDLQSLNKHKINQHLQEPFTIDDYAVEAFYLDPVVKENI